MDSGLALSDHHGTAIRPQIPAADLAQHILDLAPGRRLVALGIGRDGIGEGIGQALGAEPDHARGALLLATDGLRSNVDILDRLLDDLADLALGRWPRWHGRDDASMDGTPDPAVSIPWFRAAAKRAGLGEPPRFRRMARELELVQLLHAIDPAGVILIAEVDPACAARAAPVIEALEWCAGHGATVVAALPVPPPETSPYDRILYGACEIVRVPVPAAARFIAPRSKAHHASVIEQRVEAALRRDAELRDLFLCNESVPVSGLGGHPRVDLLCRAHRIVVELDGPEHRSTVKYGNDRHRDYELLVAGYHVLRITNEQVEADLQHAIEKIRAVVRLRRPPREF